jgi:hypothetical protein
VNVLIYKGDFRYNVVNYFAEELAQGLSLLGHYTTIYDFTNEKDDFQGFINKLRMENIDLVLSFNGITLFNPKVLEKLNIILGIILVDHPFIHLERIHEQKGKNTFICMYDRGYLDVFEEYIDKTVPIAHLMHGGTDLQITHQEKEYDIVVAGTIALVEDRISILEKMPHGIMKDIGNNLYRKALKNLNIPLDIHLKEEFDNRCIDGRIFREDRDFQQLLQCIYLVIDEQVRYKMRYSVLEAMLKAGLTVQLFGDCQIDTLKNYSNLKYHGQLDYKQLLKEISKSKVIVNDFKTCINGSHERILSSMLCKTLVLSNKNTYCNEDYKNREGIIYYDANHLDTLINSISYYLEHEDERQKVVDTAYTITKERHTWKNRAYEVEQIYRCIKGMANQ